MIALAILAAVIVLLLMLPVGVWVRYDADGAAVWAVVGPVRKKVYPRPAKALKKAKKKEKKEEEGAGPPEKKAWKLPGGSFSNFLKLVRIGVALIGALLRRVVLRRLELEVRVGGEDPARTAIQYGQAQALLASLRPLVERAFRVKKQQMQVLCDFESSQTVVLLDMQISLRVFDLLALALRYGWQAMQVLRASAPSGQKGPAEKIKKGGANHESSTS